MQVAITVWQEQVATVADFARHLRVVTVADGRPVASRDIEAPGADASQWCTRFAVEGIGTLLCGAITRHLELRLGSRGVEVVGGCAGTVDRVLADWLEGTLVPVRWHARGCRPASAAQTRFPSADGARPMRVAITTTAPGPDATLDPRFGRTRHLVVASLADGGFSDHANPTATTAEHGAGIRTAEFVAGLGVQAVITGAVGPKALQILRAAGIAIWACEGCSARAALDRLRASALTRID